MSENQRSVPWKWVAGILTLVLIAMLGAWANDITGRTHVYQATAATNSARISALEATFATILTRLDRIENKIDGQGGQR